jgi:hypothetical protein
MLRIFCLLCTDVTRAVGLVDERNKGTFYFSPWTKKRDEEKGTTKKRRRKGDITDINGVMDGWAKLKGTGVEWHLNFHNIFSALAFCSFGEARGGVCIVWAGV